MVDAGQDDAGRVAQPTFQAPGAAAAEEALNGEELLATVEAQGRARRVGSGVPIPIRRPW